MRGRKGSARSLFSLLALILAMSVLLTTPGPVQAEPSEDEVRERLEEAFNADVLELREEELNGEPVWLARIMRRGGTHNAAFQVDTVAVDRSTGEPLLGVRVEERRPTTSGKLLHERRPDVLRDTFRSQRGLRAWQ